MLRVRDAAEEVLGELAAGVGIQFGSAAWKCSTMQSYRSHSLSGCVQPIRKSRARSREVDEIRMIGHSMGATLVTR